MYKLSTKLDTIEWHSEQIARELEEAIEAF